MGNHRGIKQNKERYLYGHCIIQGKVIFFEAKYRAVSVSEARYYLCLGLNEYFNVSEFLNPAIYYSGTFSSTLISFRRSLPTNAVRCFFDWDYTCNIKKGTVLSITNAHSAFGHTDENIKTLSREHVLEVLENTIEESNRPAYRLVDKIEAMGFKMHKDNMGWPQIRPYIIYDAQNQIVLCTDYGREVIRFMKCTEQNNLNEEKPINH